MRRCTVNSSDLAIARVMSHRMAPSSSEMDWAVATVMNQVSQSAPAQPAPNVRTPVPTPSDLPKAEFVEVEMDSFDVLLAWAMELCQARAAFVVDAQGFVISSRGNPPSSGFEGIGAELCFAMEQLDRIDPGSGDLQALELHFGPSNILGIRTVDENRGAFILGFVGPRGVHESVRDTVYLQTVFNLERLR